MRIRVRKQNKDGVVRMETMGDIKEVLINEDLIHPDNESIAVCFKGQNSSGIVDFSPAEIERLYKSVRKRMHLIKGLKRFPAEDAGF